MAYQFDNQVYRIDKAGLLNKNLVYRSMNLHVGLSFDKYGLSGENQAYRMGIWLAGYGPSSGWLGFSAWSFSISAT